MIDIYRFRVKFIGSFYDITPPHSYIYRSWKLLHIIASANFYKPNNSNSGKSLLKAMTVTLYCGKMIKNALKNTEIASSSCLDPHEIIVYFHCFWYSEAFFFFFSCPFTILDRTFINELILFFIKYFQAKYP